MSTSYDKDLNVFTSCNVHIEIKVPKGYNMYVTDNEAESEIILKRNTKYNVESFEPVKTGKGIFYNLIIKVVRMRQSTIDLINRYKEGSEYRIIEAIMHCEERRKKLKKHIENNEVKEALLLFTIEREILIKSLFITSNIGIHQAVEEYFNEYPAITEKEKRESSIVYNSLHKNTK